MMQKLGDGMKKALVLGLSLFAAAGATAVEEINKQISRTTSSCDVWEVCCASDGGLTQACQDIGLRAERYTIENGYDLRKRSTSVSLTLKAKEEKPKKVWASPPCTDFSQILNLTQNEAFRKNLPRRRQESRAIVRAVVMIFKQVVLNGGDIYYEWPTGSHGWNIPELVELWRFCRRLNITLFKTYVSGCHYGMKNDKGEYLDKRWTISTTDREFAGKATCQCDGGHTHGSIQGSKLVKGTGFTRSA